PMTRETKIGLVVACSFLCLVGIVVASKWNRGDTTTREPELQENYVMIKEGQTPPEPAKKKEVRAGERQPDKSVAPLPPMNVNNPAKKTEAQIQEELKNAQKKADALPPLPAFPAAPTNPGGLPALPALPLAQAGTGPVVVETKGPAPLPPAKEPPIVGIDPV